MKNPFVLILGVVCVILFIRQCSTERSVAYWRSQALVKDVLVKEAAGRYALAVKQVSKKELKNVLKEDLKGLYTELRETKENILYYQRIVTSFRGKRDTLVMAQDKNDSTVFSFSAYYPNKDSSFINYSGTVFTEQKILSGEWRFNKLPLSIVLTQMPDKAWKSRIVGPDYFIVDSMLVMALPPEKIVGNNFDWVVGGGVGKTFNQNMSFIVSGGVRFKRNYGVVSATTGNTVYLQYLRTF